MRPAAFCALHKLELAGVPPGRVAALRALRGQLVTLVVELVALESLAVLLLGPPGGDDADDDAGARRGARRGRARSGGEWDVESLADTERAGGSGAPRTAPRTAAAAAAAAGGAAALSELAPDVAAAAWPTRARVRLSACAAPRLWGDARRFLAPAPARAPRAAGDGGGGADDDVPTAPTAAARGAARRARPRRACPRSRPSAPRSRASSSRAPALRDALARAEPRGRGDGGALRACARLSALDLSECKLTPAARALARRARAARARAARARAHGAQPRAQRARVDRGARDASPRCGGST